MCGKIQSTPRGCKNSYQGYLFMTDMRPIGFRDYIQRNGFHTVYLVKTVYGALVKIGISEDLVRRIATIQSCHFDELVFHRFWWVPGIAMASRVESGFKSRFAEYNIRGEWFDMSPAQAEKQVEAAINRLGIWSLTQSEMEHLFDDWVRKKWGLSKSAPSPLSGRAPRKDEPWEAPKKKRSHRQPSLSPPPWEGGFKRVATY
jgi:hypothetical protein